MAYLVISNWTTNQGNTEEMRTLARSKYAPSLKALGAVNCYFVETASDAFSVCTLYPDEATAKAAMAKQEALRAQAKSEMPVTFVGESRGEVFASA